MLNVQVHEFEDDEEAYTASQCEDNIHDGDVLHIPSQKIVAILYQAWPCAVTENRGGLHYHEKPPEEWEPKPSIYGTVPNYLASAEVARELMAQHGYEAR